MFNDNVDKEVFIFQTDGSLIISIKGKVNYSTWKYITANQSIIITSGEDSYMVKPAFVDGNLLALQVDGTDEYVFLIDEQKFKELVFKTYNDILEYFAEKEKALESLSEQSIVSTTTTDAKSDNDIAGLILLWLILLFIVCAFVIGTINQL